MTYQEFYLDWVNNYLTLSVMAEHYEITKGQASALMLWGRMHHAKCISQTITEDYFKNKVVTA